MKAVCSLPDLAVPPPIEVSKKNLETLINTVSLSRLAVDKQGYIFLREKLSYGYRFSRWVSTAWTTDETYEKVKEAVRTVLSHLNDDRERFVSAQGAPIRDEEIRQLILDKLPNRPEIFDPYWIFHFRNLQHILVPELKEIEADEEMPPEQKKMALALAKADLMFKLGICIKANKGASQSVIVEWFDREALGIFKPEPAKKGVWTALVETIKRNTECQLSNLSTRSLARPKAEVAVYEVDKFLKLNITCPTVICRFGEMNGSFQLFEKSMEEAKRIRPYLDSKTSFTFQEVYNFQLMVILTYLCGDLDGHDENWLVSGSERCLIERIRKIDNANSFPQKNPANRSYDSKQYAWREWRIASVPFLEESKEIMRSLTDEVINDIVIRIRQIESMALFLDSAMIKLFHQRAEVLRIAADSPNHSPAKLGKLRTDEEIKVFVNQSKVFEMLEKSFYKIPKSEELAASEATPRGPGSGGHEGDDEGVSETASSLTYV